MPVGKRISREHFLDPMRLICAGFILLLVLMTSAQCQQTAEAWFNKGNDFYDKGIYDLAINCYKEVIRIDPNHVAAWNNLGYALYSQGNFDAAIKAYDEALMLNPNFAAAQYNKGLALGRLGSRAESVVFSDPWMNSQPRSSATGHTYHGTHAPLSSNVAIGNAVGNYLANSDTKVYHYPSCTWAQKIHPENRIWFSTPNEARFNGYRPCEKCNPP